MDEECHNDQYDTELKNLGNFGDKYLALQSIERSTNRSAGQPPEQARASSERRTR